MGLPKFKDFIPKTAAKKRKEALRERVGAKESMKEEQPVEIKDVNPDGSQRPSPEIQNVVNQVRNGGFVPGKNTYSEEVNPVFGALSLAKKIRKTVGEDRNDIGTSTRGHVHPALKRDAPEEPKNIKERVMEMKGVSIEEKFAALRKIFNIKKG